MWSLFSDFSTGWVIVAALIVVAVALLYFLRGEGGKFWSHEHGKGASQKQQYASATPNKEVFKCIVQQLRRLPKSRRHIVDFGAGAGYWAMVLRKLSDAMIEGVKVTALDENPERYDATPWHPVERGGVEELRALKDAGILLLVWPPCWDEMATQALHAFAGDLLAYVGEGQGGARHSFFDALDEDWVMLEEVSIPKWHDRNDAMFLYERKASHQARRAEQNRAPSREELMSLMQGMGMGMPMGMPIGRTSSSSTAEMLLPFFRGTGADVRGRTLAEMQGYSFQQMEMVHDYIQWMFPTDEQSNFNMCAPLLTPELQRAFRDDESLRKELGRNLARFCDFLGLSLSSEGKVTVAIASHFPERVPDCWTAMFGGNHNWLRISRVLHCLGLCSMPDEQKAFMACLEEIFEKRLANCGSSIPHWRGRARTVPALP